MKTQKTLIVATDVQKIVLEQVLFSEMQKGFWKNVRPADHFDSWKGVEVMVGEKYGVTGFEIPRNYNFVNPVFFTAAKDALMATAQSVSPDITVKQLKKQLIALNQIIGSRLNDKDASLIKLKRGRKAVTNTQQKIVNTVVVKKAMANIIENSELQEA